MTYWIVWAGIKDGVSVFGNSIAYDTDKITVDVINTMAEEIKEGNKLTRFPTILNLIKLDEEVTE